MKQEYENYKKSNQKTRKTVHKLVYNNKKHLQTKVFFG